MTSHTPTAESRVLDEFRDRLAWARLRLARSVATTDGELETLAAHECRAIAEDPSTGTVGELLARLAGEARGALEAIDAAQARLEAGVFGTCEHCREAIPLPRLRAMPTARRCSECAA
jgi:DnaK suppressor protein